MEQFMLQNSCPHGFPVRFLRLGREQPDYTDDGGCCQEADQPPADGIVTEDLLCIRCYRDYCYGS